MLVEMIKQWATPEHNVGPKTIVSVSEEVAEALIKQGAAIHPKKVTKEPVALPNAKVDEDGDD